MTNSETIVLDNLPGPDSKGISDSIFTARCWRHGVNESDSWPILKNLVDLGFVARLSSNHGDGDRLYYKLTPQGAAQRQAVPA